MIDDSKGDCGFTFWKGGTMIPSCSCPRSACSRHTTPEDEPLVGYPVLVPAAEGRPIYLYVPERLRRRRSDGTACCFIFTLFLAAVVTFIVWPRSLDITVGDATLRNIHFNIKKGGSFIPQVFLDLSLDLHLQAMNHNFFGVTYENLTVSILYNDDEIAQVESSSVAVGALSSSSANATLELHSYRITSNVLKLLTDVANRAVPLQTVTTCKGYINLYILKLPLEGKAVCDLVVDPQDQLIISEVCYS
ncbi:hypothetical protein KP509_17G011700 [Ceratopteris richardii]|uniref:Late embryogenesis abundant protein LEA-2 subgroup domain-containing protein n=1 Tax=Ceratopteris richardii TaxID=49495 RepID=A0A8T2SVX6_CERRI|nr:hypothetical protein KP509_17G011700 [Ceratopteris richardii]